MKDFLNHEEKRKQEIEICVHWHRIESNILDEDVTYEGKVTIKHISQDKYFVSLEDLRNHHIIENGEVNEEEKDRIIETLEDWKFDITNQTIL